MKKFYEIFIISIFFILICFVYRGQKRISLNEGKGWDGTYYYSITEQILLRDNPIVGELPFIRRLGTPYLTAKLSLVTGLNILDSAVYVNLAGVWITVLILLVWLRKYIQKFWIRCLLCSLYMTAWYVPLRFSFYSPLTSDSWGAVWLMLSLLLLQAMRNSLSASHGGRFIAYTIGYSAAVGIGNFFRESNAILCILPFFILNPFKYIQISAHTTVIGRAIKFINKATQTYFSRQTIYLFLPVLGVVLSLLLIKSHSSVSDQNQYSYFENILSCFYTKTIPEYILGILIAFGPLILLVPLYYNQLKYLFWENQELFALLIISLLFGYIGGTDTERILFMSGFPIFFLLVGLSVQKLFYSSQKWWLYFLFMLQSIAFRLFWSLPDSTIKSGHTPMPFFGLMSSNFKYLYLYSHFSNYILNTLLLAEYLLLFVSTWYVIRYKVVLKALSQTMEHETRKN